MRPTTLHVGGTLYWTIRTRDPDTLILKDADATPTVAVRKNGASTGDSVTITKRSATTGLYDCSYNPAAEVEGDVFELEERAQVTGTTTAQAYYDSGFSVKIAAVERGTDSAALASGVNVTQLGGDTQSLTDLKDFADAGYDPSTNKVQGVVLTDALTTYTGNTPQTGDSYAVVNNGTYGSAALKAILDIIAADTTTDIPSLIATLQAFVDTEVAAIKAKTDNLPSDPADQSAVEAAITAATSPLATAANLATVAGYLDTEIAAILADTNELQTDWANGGRLDLILDARASQTSVDDLPTNAELSTALGTADDAVLAAISTLQTSVNTIDDFLDTEVAAILADTNELQTDWANGGRLDLILDAAGSAGDPWVTILPGTYTGSQAGKVLSDILVDTAELQTDWVNGGRLDLILDARSSQLSVDDLPTNAELATALGTADDAILTQVALVKAKTDNLPSDPADQSAVEAAITAATSSLATAANLATVAGYIDTEVGAIKTKTDQMVFGEINSLNVNVIHYNGTLQSNGDLPQKLDSIQSSVNTIDDFVDTEITAIKAKTDNLPASFPANFSSLGINASGHISRVVLVDTTTTNADLVSAATIATTILTTQMTESYSADGVAPTLAQALFLMQQAFTEFVITGTGISVKKLDGVTEAAGYTMDSATAPTQRLRTS